jgi:hypothetical protein
MYYLISMIVVGVPAILGGYFLLASKPKLRADAARIPKIFLGELVPDSRKEALVFGFWRFCGLLGLAFSAFGVYMIFSRR